MFEIHNFLIFLGATLIVNLTPGPDMLYVASRGMSQGRGAGIVSALGIGTGCLFHIAASALGISAVLMYSTMAFSLVKLAGAGYLIYLGFTAIIRSKDISQVDRLHRDSMFRIFRQGVLVDVFNPKVAIFFLAFLPQFADSASQWFPLQIVFLGCIFITGGTIVNILVALAVGTAGTWFRSPRIRKGQSCLSGGIMVAMGMGLALAESK